ncbi:hypothetical protein O0L34_g14318 [Tuta absoluta]|nr:hypothetical protein O0L34_g14318 [Tuta absoluta]
MKKYQANSTEQESWSRTVARCGLPAGCSSRAFSVAEFSEALVSPADRSFTIYVWRDIHGRLSTCGGAGAELAAARSRIAPHPPARTAALQASGGGLRVVCVREMAPHDELLLWPDDELLAVAGVPVLKPVHIRGGAEYRCDLCHARYDQPNPLKMHLYLDCSSPDPRAFWLRFLASLTASNPPTVPPAIAQSPAAGLIQSSATLAQSPAALEALAAAWGAWSARGGAGHACVYCGKLYSRKYGLKIHIRTHTGYKPLRCGHCARRFGDPSNLNKHVRLHAATTGSNRHTCGLCGAVLARRRDLERHLRARHADTQAHTALAAG